MADSQVCYANHQSQSQKFYRASAAVPPNGGARIAAVNFQLQQLRSSRSSQRTATAARISLPPQPLGCWSRSHKRRAASFVRKRDRDRTSQGITRGSERQRILAVPANRGTEHPSPAKPLLGRPLLKQPDRPPPSQRQTRRRARES